MTNCISNEKQQLVESLLADYNTGKYTIQNLAEKYGIWGSTIYYMLRDVGCKFTRKRRKPVSDEWRRHVSEGKKGWKMTEEQRAKLSEAKKSKYNGLNGYGHTKNHCCGYVLAYAPLHPRAHKDGYVMLHTVLLEREIGRYLEPDEVVHHINHDRQDNRIENLMLMKKKDHCSMHMKERYGKKE